MKGDVLYTAYTHRKKVSGTSRICLQQMIGKYTENASKFAKRL